MGDFDGSVPHMDDFTKNNSLGDYMNNLSSQSKLGDPINKAIERARNFSTFSDRMKHFSGDKEGKKEFKEMSDLERKLETVAVMPGRPGAYYGKDKHEDAYNTGYAGLIANRIRALEDED